MRDAGLPITLIIVGSAWLLWYFRLFPDIDWIIAAGLVAGGIAILFLDGITKNSVVAGPILIASGIAWALHDRWHVTWFVLLPTLLVLLGVLMLIARRPNIPERRVRSNITSEMIMTRPFCKRLPLHSTIGSRSRPAQT